MAFGLYVSRVQNERRAREAVDAAHGKVVYDWQVRPPEAGPDFKPEPPGPSWLRKRMGPHWFDRIVEVSLNGFNNISEQNRFTVVGPHLLKLRSLRSLTLWGGELGLEDYELIGRLTQLETLHLYLEREITPRDAAAIARPTGLRELRLTRARIRAPALLELARLPTLELLHIDSSAFDRQTGGAIREFQLTDDAAAAIGTFPRLRSLMLFATQITDDGMEELGRLSQLERLVVSSPRITSASFDHVLRLSRLEYLGAWQWQVDDADIVKLNQLPRLTSLTLRTRLTNESVACVARLEQIERLTLDSDGIDDAGLQPLLGLTNLAWLDLSDTSVDKHGTAANELRQALPKCVIRLPKTEEEKERERAFNAWKWGG